jgi:hypothetical protein
MGGGGGKKSSDKPAPDNGMQLWAAEMDKQRKYQQEQYEQQRKYYEDLRKEEDQKIAVDNAKREQSLWNEKQTEKDAQALEKYQGATETYAQQTGAIPEPNLIQDPTTAAINQRLGDKSKSSLPAPGLTPFGTNIVKPANQIYQMSQSRLGGS